MKKKKPIKFISLHSVLSRHFKDPVFREGFEKRRLIQEVAVAVRGMREQAGLTQAQLAKLIKSTQPTIARLEKGSDQRTPRFDLLYKIGAALGRQLRLVFTVATKAKRFVEVEDRASA